MIHSEIKTVRTPDGETERLQIVRIPDWKSLDFFHPQPVRDPLSGILRIYRQFLVPACPWIFGQMALLGLPGGENEPAAERQALSASGIHDEDPEDALFRAADCLQEGLRLRKGKAFFRTDEAEALWQRLGKEGLVKTVSGKLPFTKIIPVSGKMGLLSESEPQAALKVNASFFIFDPFDCATLYDSVGTPFGLCVKDGRILSPPLYGREALLVCRDGRVRVEKPLLKDLTLEIRGKLFRAGRNAELVTRPDFGRTAAGSGPEVMITGRKVRAVNLIGGLEIPAGGFVLRSPDLCGISPGDEVSYHGLEEISFGIQVGSSLLKDGVPSGGFLSPFYNVRSLKRTAYPPSLYPLDYQKARAARIALGADKEGSPLLLWAEGAPKTGYRKGKTSCGASLSEMEEYCVAAGFVNAVNLDGGGSAQILLSGRRSLEISDRTESGEELERAVPTGLVCF